MSFPDCRAPFIQLWPPDGGSRPRLPTPTRSSERWTRRSSFSSPALRHSGTTPRALQHPGASRLLDRDDVRRTGCRGRRPANPQRPDSARPGFDRSGAPDVPPRPRTCRRCRTSGSLTLKAYHVTVPTSSAASARPCSPGRRRAPPLAGLGLEQCEQSSVDLHQLSSSSASRCLVRVRTWRIGFGSHGASPRETDVGSATVHRRKIRTRRRFLPCVIPAIDADRRNPNAVGACSV